MPTIAYRYRLRRVLSNERLILDEIRAGHHLYNDLVAIERTRRDETQAFWAQVGGYTFVLQAFQSAVAEAADLAETEGVGSPRQADAWMRSEALRKELRRREQVTVAAYLHPAKARRKSRARELIAEAKQRGQKISADELSRLLDADPDCVSPRDRVRLELQREYETRGVALSAKAVAKRLREDGLAGPTEHIEAKARAAAYAAYQFAGSRDQVAGVFFSPKGPPDFQGQGTT